MKTFVISLKRRDDRKKLFSETNSLEYQIFDATDGWEINYQWLINNGFDTNKNWIDPLNNTHITHGEVACYLSHYYLWVKCIVSKEPIIILEDDAIVSDKFSIEEIKQNFEKGYNFMYLGYREMGSSEEIDDKFVKPDYPYWTIGYALTPLAAQILVNQTARQNIIPVDEYLPLMMRRLKPIAYKENVVDPWDRSVGGTDVDPTNRYSYFIDFNTHALTVGSDDSKCEKLHFSSERHGFSFNNLGKNVNWRGTDMSGPGGGQKVNLLKSYLDQLPDHDVVLFADGYDVFVNDVLEEITRRYLEFKCKVLFAAEEWCWPDEGLMDSFPQSHTKYRYLNSGLFIGRVDELKKILSKPIEDYEDDQLYYQKQFLSGEFDIRLDYESYVFQCHDSIVGSNRAGELSPNGRNQLMNPLTQCCPCVYHGNGGSDAKQHFEKLYASFYGTPIVYIPTHKYEMFGNDILMVDYLTPTMCDELIATADKNGQWGSLSYDKFPAQEIRLKKLGLWNAMVKHWEEYLYPIIEHYWKPMEMYGMRDAFVMRYAMDTQRKLNLHTDASLVTGSVKLNDNYEGAELVFPRQGFSNKDIPVGKCLLFPGAVTHGHECTELKSGVKYSLTMWSCRYKGDVV
jgi:GR25 family glycosyltransferase involved in LPS biosynthesis